MNKKLLIFLFLSTLFSCEKKELANITTNDVSEITINSAKSGGEILSDGNSFITERGVCWSTGHNPTISNSHSTDGNGNESYLSTISGLTESTTYYVRSYATNEAGVSYGEEKSFTTLNIEAQFVVITNPVTNITTNSATCSGTVVSDGNNAVTAKGMCWSTNQNPTISDSHSSNGQGLGVFISMLSNLSIGTTYYVRAFATNSEDTIYGEQKQFTTINPALPVVSTSGASTVNATSAICGGNVTSDGNSSVTAKGVCWGTTQNPNITGNHTSNGQGLGGFTSNLTNLSAGTTYYIRAYATNSSGTAYGTQKTFTTITTSLPTVTTSNITNILSTTATFGGDVTSDGNSVVTAKGVCWSTTQNPTISGNHTSNGQGLGVFSGQLTNLTSGTLYYVRAYATNSSGTAYGPQKEFATSSCPSTTVNDIEGHTYTTISMGSQCWMKENLRTTKYSNGTDIALGSNPNNYSSSAQAYYTHSNTVTQNSNDVIYGLLYNGYVVRSSNNVCPTGWHVPTNSEFIILMNYIKGNTNFQCNNIVNNIAKAMASASYWNSSTVSCAIGNIPTNNNGSGFSVLPSGTWEVSDGIEYVGQSSGIWTSTSYSSVQNYYLYFMHSSATVSNNYGGLSGGVYSIRCIKD